MIIVAGKRVEYAIELLLGAKKKSNFDSTVNGVSSGIDAIGGTAKKVATGRLIFRFPLIKTPVKYLKQAPSPPPVKTARRFSIILLP